MGSLCSRPSMSMPMVSPKRAPPLEPIGQPRDETLVPRMTMEQLRIVTNNFSSQIASAAVGDTYEGALSNGRAVAVRVLKTSPESLATNAMFLEEVKKLYRLQNSHLAGLVAFCQDGDEERALIYEHVPGGGSLYDHLHEDGYPPLSWDRRMRIAVGVALGLDYLHHEADPPAAHGSLKSTNVLLDQELAAKLSDTTFNKELLLGKEAASPLLDFMHEPGGGSFGYIDPSFVNEMSDKMDTYSFGVLLLELITGQKAMLEDYSPLLVFVQQYLKNPATYGDMVDPVLADTVPADELEVVVNIAQSCTRILAKRPSMNHVKTSLISKLHISPNDVAPLRPPQSEITFEGDDFVNYPPSQKPILSYT
eukprot:TRINITY_DN332_c0_g1_i13.p1 TRINITY_DN332_c0_g1~~TRINITY_DN332_c0_g1_i13.p1  ORF type:complete len:365 (+),score=70.88 TRINITY_DN332_c0_g1_i13:1361-2455(+)